MQEMMTGMAVTDLLPADCGPPADLLLEIDKALRLHLAL